MLKKKRKLIGVFVNQIDNSYHQEICTSLSKHSAANNIDVYIFNANGNSHSGDVYEKMEPELLELAPIEEMDGIVVLADTYSIDEQRRGLLKAIKRRAKPELPVVVLRGSFDDCDRYLGKDSYFRVDVSENAQFERLIEHIIDFHHAKRICYMSGPREHTDAINRLGCFRRMMEKYGLEIRENALFYGDFWHGTTDEALDLFYSDPEWIPEAIICANDYMATDVVIKLSRRGVAMPDDVIVTGFDNIPEATCSFPPLTTVGVDYRSMAYTALDTIIKAWNGEEQPRVIHTEPVMCLRESCGCRAFNSISVSEGRNRILMNNRMKYDFQIANTYFIMNAIGSKNLDEFSELIVIKARSIPDCSEFYMCLCTDGHDDDIAATEYTKKLSEQMLTFVAIKDGKVYNTRDLRSDDRVFDRCNVLPGLARGNSAGCYYFILLHSREQCFGYAAIRFKSHTVYDYDYQCWLINAALCISEIINSIRLERAITLNEYLSVTDSLTGLLNRRGYDERIKGLCREKGFPMSVQIASIDLNNLKQINDRYGHAEGDFAIRTAADAIRTVASGGIVSRMGGDEFVVVTPLPDGVILPNFERYLTDELAIRNGLSGKPYAVTASVGICNAVIESFDMIEELLHKSDERLYMAKRRLRRRMEDVED